MGLALDLGLRLGRGGGRSYYDAPVATLTSGESDATPNFTWGFPIELVEGDVFRERIYSEDLTTLIHDLSHNLTAGDLAETPFDIAHTDLANGTYKHRFWAERAGKRITKFSTYVTSTVNVVSAITVVDSVESASNTATLPTLVVGDLVIAAAYRANATAAALATGYTNIDGGTLGASGVSIRPGYLVADATSETCGPWTNAKEVEAVILRGAAGGIGAFAITVSSSTTLTFPALTLQNTDGTSRIILLAMHISEIPPTPTGFTLLQSNLNTEGMAMWISTAPVASFAGVSVTVAGAAHRQYSIEARQHA